MNPVARKPVLRKLDEAELLMLVAAAEFSVHGKIPGVLDHFPMMPPIYDGIFHCYTVSHPSYGCYGWLMIMNTMALWLYRP